MRGNMKHFDVREVPIQGLNLIEASAGTGKTYSIAILILRIIIEGLPNVPESNRYPTIDKLLVATFTKAAVAELQTRIRNFIHEAYQYINGTVIDDPLIQTLIDTQLTKEHKSSIAERIQAALYTMDEAHITSIHGFSQRILQEFSFETHFSSNATIIKDNARIVEQVANMFWRKEVTTLPIDILQHMNLSKFKASNLDALKYVLAGKDYYPLSVNGNRMNIPEANEALLRVKEQQQALLESISSQLRFDTEGIWNEIQHTMKGQSKKFQLPLSAESLIKDIQSLYKENNKTVLKLQGHIWTAIQEYLKIDEKIEAIIFDTQVSLTATLINNYIPIIKQRLQDINAYTFDGIIHQLYKKIVTESNERLIQLIRNKYAVIFIDEFQDTDLTQFEIFEKLFIQSNQNIVFLIGDPKQSIYAFRNADIESYLHAKSSVQHAYTMRTNFRSSKAMIAAVNDFYNTIGLSTAFGYENNQSLHNSIQYEIIESNTLDKELIIDNELIQQPLQLIAASTKPALEHSLVAHISNLLANKEKNKIWDKTTKCYRGIIPSDIGILTLTKHQGESIKNILESLNIPAVQIRENTIFQTAEAIELIYILEAMLQPNLPNVRRAIFTTLLNVHKQINVDSLVKHMDDAEALNLFYNYSQLLNEETILVAMNKLMDDFSIQQHYQHTTAQLRTISNLEQLLQICNEQQYRKSWNAFEILEWIKKNINDEDTSEDAYLTQIESDEDAVKIVTIHKSKGLEYNIVYVTGIEQVIGIKNTYNYIDFKLSSHPRKYFLEANSPILSNASITAEIIDQLTRERYRLIYVAITRAVYACHIFYSSRGINNSPLSKMLGSLSNQILNSIACIEGLDMEQCAYGIQEGKKHTPIVSFNKSQALASRSNWRRMSITALSVHSPFETLISEEIHQQYADFIFNKLPRGAKAGIALHTLLESIDYNVDYINWDNIPYYIKTKIEAFSIQTQLEAQDLEHVLHLIHQILHAQIAINNIHFQLKELEHTKMIHELQFNFNVDTHHRLNQLIDTLNAENIEIHITDEQLKGLMTGFIDLFFEHQGKYFILDWKSNFLGNTVEAYSAASLESAMQINNYNLQYTIYTVAAVKYLHSRIPDFDYDKHFGGIIYVFIRGVEAGSQRGIYCYKPNADFIHRVTTILNP